MRQRGEIENIILSSNADVIIIDPEREYSSLVKALGGEIINISATSPNHINAMDMNKEYGDGANPVILKSEFIMSLCEQLIGGSNLGAKQKSIIDRCTASVYRTYQQNNYTGTVPTLQDFRAELLKQDEPEAQEIALAIELFTNGSLNTFAKQSNVDTANRLICYDILDLGKQLMPIGMLVVLDSILNRLHRTEPKVSIPISLLMRSICFSSTNTVQTSFLPFGSVCVNTVRMQQALHRMWTTFCRAIRQGQCSPIPNLSLC